MRRPVVAFTDLTQAVNTARKNLNPILDFHLQGLDGQAIDAGAFNPESTIRITSDPSEAEYFILPKHWTCYLWNGRRDLGEAAKLAELADRFGKPLIVWFKGDLVPRIPFKNYILFLPGMVRSSRKRNHISCPVFVDDPREKFAEQFPFIREKSPVPTVGFCGYASNNPLKTSWSILNGLGLKLVEKFGHGNYEALPILPSTFLRSRALRAGARSRSVKTDFLIRQSYTPTTPGGTNTNGDPKLAAFFANVFGTDYTLCMRGYGNWSYRFYETLACGRVPVFIDTECVLPLDDIINWKRYCVWIDRSEVPHLGEKIAAFHAGLSQSDFVALQKACRQLWEDRLTLRGFMTDLPIYLSKAN